MIELVIDNKVVDFFEDEGIELTQALKDIRDIGAIFTDFTQSFTVPATEHNNTIFKHYYRPEMLNGFSVLKRVDAQLRLSGIPLKTGSIQLEEVEMKNNQAASYKLTFYGALGNMNEVFGDKTLQDLNFNQYEHAYSAAKVNEGLTKGLFNGDIIYPLCSPKRNWIYNSNSNNHQANNIHYHVDDPHVDHGVNFYELKPAIKVKAILNQIQSDYGFTFTGSILNDPRIAELYLWLHNREGYLFEDEDEKSAPYQRYVPDYNESSTAFGNWFFFAGTNDFLLDRPSQVISIKYVIRVDLSNLNANCAIVIYGNGQVVSYQSVTAPGGQFDYQVPINQSNVRYRVEIERQTPLLNYTIKTEILEQISVINSVPQYQQLIEVNATEAKADINIAKLMPELKVVEFLDGLAKLHNLTITSDDGETFDFEPYNDFIGSGNTVDLNEDIDTSEFTIKPVDKFKNIEFKYQESDQIQQKKFRKVNGRGYGDLVQSFNFDTEEELTVELPFDQPYFTVMLDQFTSDYVNFPVYKSISAVDDNGEGESYYGAPILFYHNTFLDIAGNSIAFLDEAGVQSEVTTIPYVNTINGTLDTSLSTNFSEDPNEFTLIQSNVPANINTLYADYWQEVIQNAFNSQARLAEIQAYISKAIVRSITLKDIIIWNGRRWRINQISTNFSSDKSDIELITIV